MSFGRRTLAPVRSASPPSGEVPGRTAAGRSAEAGYRHAVRRRRGAAARSGASLVTAGSLLWAAARWSGTAREAALGVASAAVLAALVLRPERDPERWLRGSAGEAATARLLAGLPGSRWAVMHDLEVPGSRANIDHLVIGPTGVWVIDTKTRRGQPSRGLRTLRVGGRPLDTAPVAFEAQVVSDRLRVRARPLVAVHGLDLPRRGVTSRGVRVVAAARLVRLVRRPGLLRWPWWNRLGRHEVERLTRLAESTFAPAGCSCRSRR